MELLTYLSSLSIPNLFSRMPAAAAQGIIWGIMALGVYITFRLLNVSDLTVDGSFATGGAVTVMLLLQGLPAWAALLIAVLVGILTGLCTGLLHTKFGIPAILAGILTQFALYSINLRIMGKANQTASIKNFGMFWETNGKGLSVSSHSMCRRRSLQDCFFLPHWLRCCIGTSAPNREARCVPRARTPR